MRTAFAVAIAASLLAGAPALAADIDWNKVDQALGKKGADQPGDVHKYGLPRSDLHVTVDGVVIKPSLALGGWLAFHPMGSGAMVMGDLVLTEREINPVMSKLLSGGITITAVHNHLLRTQPATFYMHVAGQGDPIKLATAFHDALSASATPFTSPAAAPPPERWRPHPLSISTKNGSKRFWGGKEASTAACSSSAFLVLTPSTMPG
jgi:hypothetical protein